MAALGDSAPLRSLAQEWLKTSGAAALRVYRLLVEAHAQLLFSRSPLTGALLLGVTLFQPRLALAGLVALLAGRWLTQQFGLSDAEWEHGPYAANLLLLGLGLAHAFANSVGALLLLIAAAAAGSLLVWGLRYFEGRGLGLPPLALGFVISHALFVSSGRAWELAPLQLAPPPSLSVGWLDASLGALGSLLFQPTAAAGAVLWLALLTHSRIAALCATLALVGARSSLAAFSPLEPALAQCLTLNAVLVVLALSTVWFVPSARALALGLLMGGVLVLGFGGIALRLYGQGVALSILPFHLVLYTTLLALRQRLTDAAPHPVDFLPGTPEQNLAFHSERKARFPWARAPELTLPFRGTWVCTQGVDGPHTHRELWRYAWDFEVSDARGSCFEGSGAEREAYLCYRLPALAVAPGTVVAVQNGIADNAIGDLNVDDRFGNYVVVCHGPALYSLLAHLAPGSVKVVPGAQVARGSVLGLVGSSGRSPRPHLHFNLQVGPEPGAATLPCYFSDAVVVEDTALVFSRTRQISEGMSLRPLSSSAEPAGPLGLRLGERLTLELNGRLETLSSSVDLLGGQVLVSDRGGRLHVQTGPSGYVAHDALGPADSVVHLLRACLPRLPSDDAPKLHFDDVIRDAWAFGPALNWLADFVAFFRSHVGHRAKFVAVRTPNGLVVEGQSAETARFRRFAVTTRVELGPRGLQTLQLQRGLRRYRAQRVFGRAPRVLTSSSDAVSPANAAWIAE